MFNSNSRKQERQTKPISKTSLKEGVRYQGLPQVAENKIPQPMDAVWEHCLYAEFVRQINQKEKSHAYLDHHYSAHTMVAWIFWTECLFRDPPFGKLHPHTARHRGYPYRFESVGSDLEINVSLNIGEAADLTASRYALQERRFQWYTLLL
jgi:hypothetical protein